MRESKELKNELGKDYKDIELEDDNTEFGGIDFVGETLGHFLDTIEEEPKTLEELNKILKECGIKELKEQL